MKVLHILNELKFSGAEIMYVAAAPIFQEKGCKLSVLATAKNLGEFAPYFTQAGYQVLHKPIPKVINYLGCIKYYISIISLLKKEKCDIVHIHSHRAMWGMAFCSWITNTKCIYTFHNVFPSRTLTYPYHFIRRWSAKNIFKCCFQTISDSVYNHELNFYHNKTTKVYNWYNSNRYYPATSEEKMEARKELGIDSDAFVMISVGGCSPIKRHTEIIKAMPSIIEKIPNILYLHLGNGISEAEEINLARELCILERIKFCGNQTDVRKYLISADVYLMPSRFEGIPITTIEAMACQIPAILYNVPGLRDFNKKGEVCMLIPEDYKVIVEKILELHNNSKKYAHLPLRGKDFVTTYFDMKSNVEQIFDLYTNPKRK